MAFERADRLAAFQIPEPQRLVIRSRDAAAYVGRHRHGQDRERMTFEGAQCLPLSKCQSRSVRSFEAKTALRPSGVTATAQTENRAKQLYTSF